MRRLLLAAALLLLGSGAQAQSPPLGLPGEGNSGYPPGATPLENSGLGSTGGASATLNAQAGKFTYMCGFSASLGSATAAITTSVTTTGLSNNMSWTIGAPVTAAGVTGNTLSINFFPCVSASAINTAIQVIAGALGAGGVNQTVNVWGYQR